MPSNEQLILPSFVLFKTTTISQRQPWTSQLLLEGNSSLHGILFIQTWQGILRSHPVLKKKYSLKSGWIPGSEERVEDTVNESFSIEVDAVNQEEIEKSSVILFCFSFKDKNVKLLVFAELLCETAELISSVLQNIWSKSGLNLLKQGSSTVVKRKMSAMVAQVKVAQITFAEQ